MAKTSTGIRVSEVVAVVGLLALMIVVRHQLELSANQGRGLYWVTIFLVCLVYNFLRRERIKGRGEVFCPTCGGSGTKSVSILPAIKQLMLTLVCLLGLFALSSAFGLGSLGDTFVFIAAMYLLLRLVTWPVGIEECSECSGSGVKQGNAGGKKSKNE